MLLRLTRLLAATVLVAAGGAVATTTPASAASCTTSTGVTVVVDPHGLGGGVRAVCDAGGGGKYASTIFGEAGFPLTYVQREPGFVCRVDNQPSSTQQACVNTPPANAYWGLWWSNGTSGTWTYANYGVGAQKIPAGGSVAFSWNGSSTKSPPGTTPPARASSPAPKPTPTPTPSPGSSGPTPTSGTTAGGSTSSGSTSGGTAGGGSTTGASPSASAAPGTVPARKPRAQQRAQQRARQVQARSQEARAQAKADGEKAKKKAKRAEASTSPSASASASASRSASAGQAVSSDPPGAEGDALPVWLAPAGIALLFAAAGATALVRRRRGTSGP